MFPGEIAITLSSNLGAIPKARLDEACDEELYMDIYSPEVIAKT
jgi:hypothetical protein